MEYKQIQELIKFVNKSNITELSIEEGDFKLKIKQGTQNAALPPSTLIPASPAYIPAAGVPAVPPAAQASAPAKEEKEEKDKPQTQHIAVKSPMIGTFYRSPSPDKPPYIQVGDEISPGQVICIIEAMKLFNEIESEVAGRVVKVMAEDASPVEYDQVLFLVEPL